MTNYSSGERVSRSVCHVSRVTRYAPRFALLLIPILYLLTLAHTLVLGDPTEFTFVANILGIAHPPGYAFITLVGKGFQTLIPFGSIPWRMHLLAAASATAASLFAYSTVRTINRQQSTGNKIRITEHEARNTEYGARNTEHGTRSSFFDPYASIPALFAALVVATAADFWQHAIHANPHIITATFLAANLFFLTRWALGDKVADSTRNAAVSSPHPVTPSPSHPTAPSQKWLYAFSLSAGLGVTHHPLTVIAFPAYALFILWVRPSILRDWRTWLKMLGFALLGLSVWLYFPIRSPMRPPFGPSTMNTLDGFLDHVLARGLTESLPYFGLADQPDRALVFWTLLRLQYTLPVIFLAAFGFFRLWFGDNADGRQWARLRQLAFLYGLSFLCNYVFVISLKAQDIMAYLLGPFLVVGLMAGIGLGSLLRLLRDQFHPKRNTGALIAAALFFAGPGIQIAQNAPRISLRPYNEGRAYVEAVFSWFEGKGEGAVLLNDWERMTPLWYARYVEGHWPDAADVRPEFVSSARTWLENVFDFLPGGPVYLSNYRRDVVDAGFRLRPSGPFYQVAEPGDVSIPADLTRTSAAGGEVELVGYLLPETAVRAGDYVPLTLAMRAPQGTDDFYVPVLRVGNITFPFTTDSHLISPNWQPGEVIVEQFDFALPHDLADGRYPVTVDLRNLSTGTDFSLALSLGELTVSGQRHSNGGERLLANFRQRVGLVGATARGGGHRAASPWDEPFNLVPGDTLHLTLQWESLAPAEESYTVFVHLIDLANRPIVALDYTPLGGATPTHLWIPKWLPGQRMLDPYRLQIPEGLSPGTYLVEVGLYEMVSGRRLHIFDTAGNLVGDRVILGSVEVGTGE
ncbi:MAG: protein O-mannosyl-transferase family [Anaerolineae bacterium]